MAKKKDRMREASETFTDVDPEFTPEESSAGEATPTGVADASEDGPDASPYRTSPHTLLIGPDRVEYTIVQAVLDKCPKWAGSRKPDSWASVKRRNIELPDIDEDSGHTIVHYLYTGTYQTLKLRNVLVLSDEAKNLAEYTRCMRLYCITKQCDLVSLSELAKQYAETHSQRISLTEMLEVAEEVFKKLPSDEVWFTECLKQKMKVALEADKAAFTKDSLLDHIGNFKNLDRTLVKCIAEIYAERDSHKEEPSCTVEEPSPSIEIFPRTDDSGKAVEPLDVEAPTVLDKPAPAEELPPAPEPDPTSSQQLFWGWETRNSKHPSLRYTDTPIWCPPTPPPPPPPAAAAAAAAPPPTEPAPPEEVSKSEYANSATIEESTAYEICEPKKETEPEDSWGSWSPIKKKGKKKVSQEHEFDFMASEEPVEICGKRATHLQQDRLWKQCSSCRAFIEGVARRSTILEF